MPAMRPATVVAVVPFLLASVAPAQAGVVPAAPLNATEVAAFAAVRTWQQQLADGRIGVES